MKPPLRYVALTIKDQYNDSVTYLNSESVGPRIDFSVVRKTQTFGAGFSTAIIKVYNQSDVRFNFIKQKGKEISLIAGNENIVNASKGQIFDGFVYSVARTKVDTDIITTIYCSTVDPNNPKTHKIYSKSYQSIALTALLQDLGAWAGVTVTLGDNGLDGIKIKNRSYFNDVNAVFDDLARRYEFTWEVRGSTVVINTIGSSNVKNFEFSHSSGLLEPPIITEKGVDIKVFLTPNINPQDNFTLNAEFASYNLGALEFQDRITDKVKMGNIVVQDDGRYVGFFHVLFLAHEGSTHTNQWYTRIEGLYGQA